MKLLIALLLVTATGGIAHAEWAPKEGGALVGTRAPELVGLRWLQGGPFTMEKLRGKVVLIRFWTDGCQFCSSTAPSLKELDARYRDQGLVVIGVHHPKSKDSDPEKSMRELGFTFPVATDKDWQTVKGWGVGTTFKTFTSISYLVDKEGVIRFVHDGGEWHTGGGKGHEKCQAGYDALTSTLAQLLRQ
jgi:thiol-disulfide isomerase/thioredoxin